mmetsp:Transcript_137074/g.292763  ORF Transcript_137074/g.292763 Transcript_137074/m.292763 type:complete len:419 (+) Transcript_137074:92-1348(+)
MVDDWSDSRETLDHWRWHALASCVFHSIINQIMFFDFASIPHLTKLTFQIDDAEVKWLYTISLIAAIPTIFCIMALLDTYKVAVALVGVGGTAIASLLRLVAAHQASFTLAILSSVALGVGYGKVLVDFTAITKTWFASSPKEHAMATAIVVQGSFFGWALGGVIVPVVHTQSGLIRLCIVQAICASLCWLIHLPFNWAPSVDEERPSEPTEHTALKYVAGQSTIGIGKSLTLMLCNSSFLMLLVGGGLCQGIAFAVPAISAEALLSNGVRLHTTAWANFGFIMSGVIVGLIIGRSGVVGKKILILNLSWVLMGALVGLQLVASSKGMGQSERDPIMILLMLASGASSLGSVNAVVERICEVALPIPETHAGGTMEVLGLVLASFLTQWSVGQEFKVLAGASICAAVATSVGLFLKRP